MEEKKLVILYSSPTCTICRAVKTQLSNRGITYEERLVTTGAIRKEAIALKIMSIPAIKYGEKLVVGYGEEMQTLIDTIEEDMQND